LILLSIPRAKSIFGKRRSANQRSIFERGNISRRKVDEETNNKEEEEEKKNWSGWVGGWVVNCPPPAGFFWSPREVI